MANRFSVEAVFKAIDQITAPVTRMQNRVGKFTRSMSRGLNKLERQTGRLTAGIKKTAAAATIAFGLTGAAMGDVVSTGATFEQSLINAAARFPGEIRKGTEAYEGLEQAARAVGATTEFTASQTAEALNFLAMAGFDAKSAMAALPGVVDLATASGTDLATATDIATDSLGAFNLLTKDPIQLAKNLARVNDVLVKTSTSANTTVETLFETLKDGGPAAVAAGQSIETVAAMAGTMANAGIKASRGGTALKNMFIRMAAPTKEAVQALNLLQVKTVDGNGDLRDMFDIVQDLNGAMEGMGSGTRTEILDMLFGKIPISGVNAVLNSGADALRDYRTVLDEAAGSSGTMADVMRDSLQGRMNSFKSAVESVKISITTMNDGPLADVIDKSTAWVRANEALIATKVTEFLAKIFNNLEKIVHWIKIIGKVLVSIWAFSTAVKAVTGAMLLFNIAMAANPITLVVLAVTALVAALVALWFWWDEIVGVMKSAVQPAVDAVSNAFAKLMGWWDGLGNGAKTGILLALGPIGLMVAAAKTLMTHWEPVGEFFKTLWAGIKAAFDVAIAGIKATLDTLLGALTPILDGLGAAKDFGGGLIDDAVDFYSPAVTAAADKTGGLFDGIGDFIFGEDTPEVSSPNDRTARAIEERTETNKATLTIEDQTGRAQLSGGMGPGIQIQSTGNF